MKSKSFFTVLLSTMLSSCVIDVSKWSIPSDLKPASVRPVASVAGAALVAVRVPVQVSPEAVQAIRPNFGYYTHRFSGAVDPVPWFGNPFVDQPFDNIAPESLYYGMELFESLRQRLGADKVLFVPSRVVMRDGIPQLEELSGPNVPTALVVDFYQVPVALPNVPPILRPMYTLHVAGELSPLTCGVLLYTGSNKGLLTDQVASPDCTSSSVWKSPQVSYLVDFIKNPKLAPIPRSQKRTIAYNQALVQTWVSMRIDVSYIKKTAQPGFVKNGGKLNTELLEATADVIADAIGSLEIEKALKPSRYLFIKNIDTPLAERYLSGSLELNDDKKLALIDEMADKITLQFEKKLADRSVDEVLAGQFGDSFRSARLVATNASEQQQSASLMLVATQMSTFQANMAASSAGSLSGLASTLGYVNSQEQLTSAIFNDTQNKTQQNTLSQIDYLDITLVGKRYKVAANSRAGLLDQMIKIYHEATSRIEK